MENQGRGRPWGKLIRVDSSCESEVLLVNRECTVGRRKGCDLSFPANKLVSGDHCKIVQDEKSGLAWLEDMSTNGTVINMSKLVKKQSHMLQSGDVIYFVYRKTEPEQNIAYVYQSLKPELAVSHDTSLGASGGAPALGSSPPLPPATGLSVEPLLLRAPGPHRAEEPQPSTSTFHLPAGPHGEVQGESASCHPPGCKDVSGPAPPRQGGLEEPECKRRKIDADAVSDLASPHTSSTEALAPAKGSLRDLLGKQPKEGTKTDKMEESLTCIICQDLLHDCVSLQPCMHTFCAACYSGWMERSSLCPTCRCPVERLRKNHILNNLVEAYLTQHPEKCRCEEDLKSMDSRNKITQDMLQPKIERSFSDEEGSSDYLFELSDNDSDTSDISGQPFAMCRQCLGYRADGNQGLWATGIASPLFPSAALFPSAPLFPPAPLAPPPPPAQPAPPGPAEGAGKPAGEGPSTSSEMPTAPSQGYSCPLQGRHVICTCCLQPMPDRRAELIGHQLSAQQCMACQRPFCHMYWGCRRIGCQGCLARFSELNLTDKCLDGVLNSNNYESEILQNYLAARGMTWRSLLQEGLDGLQQGSYYLSDYRINASAVLCFCCGLRAFKELAYKYRQNIPAAELPVAVTSRPDCYWGRNCRTQVKAHHAMKFNHICEQTRFKS
ncbi:E3 ubiquitin-protein ligase CHFR isoform X2 [Hypomesus transpacificus]|uniref:E3 ubiquitin-protein ligase CHFR isoform X2 n=1 Tax=Hypomesus transpacificus TaxID=137520 RepID=UPI001F07A5EA|nr:E3 ubiquitin-protein ligase CHFR isoform X2 [Hypomesus transpacificus]